MKVNNRINTREEGQVWWEAETNCKDLLLTSLVVTSLKDYNDVKQIFNV